MTPGESRFMIVEQPTTTVALDSAADLKNLIVAIDCTIVEIGVIVAVATATTAGVYDFDRRVTPSSDTGRVDQGVGRLTFAAIQAVGSIVRKAVRVDINAGDEIVFSGVTAAGGSSPTGVPYMLAEYRPTAPGDFTERTTSV